MLTVKVTLNRNSFKSLANLLRKILYIDLEINQCFIVYIENGGNFKLILSANVIKSFYESSNNT